MARVLVTGSADGLGLLTARLLVGPGHGVVLHARDGARGREALAAAPGAEAVLTGDLASLAQARALAERANAAGPFDTVVHNAAVGFRERRRLATEDGLPHVLAVNALTPYVLTALMHKPRRLVYVGSELHRRGDASLDDLLWERRSWNGHQAYCDSKLHVTLLAFAVARRWSGCWPTRWSRAGCRPGWAARARRGTWTRAAGRRRGSRPATTPKRR